jgi:butyrate kinase
MRILLINTGGTSTKIGLAVDGSPIDVETVRHDSAGLRRSGAFWSQYELRRAAVLGFLEGRNVTARSCDPIVSRGAVVRPLASGVYAIDGPMLEDARSGRYGQHPCALGCAIALELAAGTVPALTVDPPCVDEMIAPARLTGLPQIGRRSYFHALNHKAVGRRLAAQLGKRYEELDLVICHLGSGISVASHRKGRVIDVTNGLEGDSPFGLDRTGTLPAADWMKLCLSGDYAPEQLHRMLNGEGGMMAHLGTTDAVEVERRVAAGDAHAAEVYDAMAFQVAKGIGAAASALGARPDAVVLTGGLANSDLLVGKVRERVAWMAPFHVFAGEDEMRALAEGARRALAGEVPVRAYDEAAQGEGP